MGFGDGMRMSDTPGIELGPAVEVPAHCDHVNEEPGTTCSQCQRAVPCPHCHVAGNISKSVKGLQCLNCNWISQQQT
jgi:hypothetical protein